VLPDADALATAWRFEVAIQDAVARERIPLAWGTGIRSPDLPAVYDANLSRIERRFDEVSAGELLAELERVRRDAEFDKLLVPDEEAARRLRPDLEAAGFRARALVVMAWRGDRAEAVARADGAREAGGEELRPVRIAISEAELAEESRYAATEIAALQERIAEAFPTRFFAAPTRGEVGSFCSLYARDGVAQLEDVNTVDSRRGEGLSTAAVGAAIRAALETADELFFVNAVEDDWVRDWYARLGFEVVGRRWDFTRTAG
jgi:hypothetical protein